MLVDAHCHPYHDPDPAGALARARDVGVGAFIVPCYDGASWDAVDLLVAEHPDVHPAYGLHPWVAHEPLDLSALATLLRRPGTVAVGEIGLDFKLDTPGRAVQIAVFRDQLALARETGLPVVLHVRGAFEELLEILESDGCPSGVVHAFSRGPELATRFLGLGLHLGLGGAITQPSARRPRRSAVVAPLERIVLETDAPSLGLDGIPAGESEPAHVVQVARALAALRGLDVETVARITTRTARELFRLP